MQIPRSVVVLIVWLAAVAAWWLAAARDPVTVRVLAAEMAPARVTADGRLPTHPPEGLDWRALDLHALAGWQGPYWLRWRLPAAADAGQVRALRLSVRGASQPLWNGRPLPPNGVVGRTPAEERPGRIDSLYVLPPSNASSASDTLAVLASSHHQRVRLYSADAFAEVGPAARLYDRSLLPWLIAAFASGGLAAACAYFLAVQRGRQRMPGVRLLLALGAVGLALPVVEAWRPLLGYAYPWHAPRLVALLALHVAAAALLPAYLARRFGVAVPLNVQGLYVLVLAAAALLLPSFDASSLVALLLSMLASAWVLLRVDGQREERVPILVLLLAGALTMPLVGGAFLDGPYFLLLAVLMGFLLVRHVEQLRAMDRHNAWLREERARLSLQLLQRGIQPHWLMNTLTCLQELIEQAPSRASGLVEALAAQFDRLRDSSARQSVPLEDELALCRSHLDIVGQALDCPIGFEVDADDTGLSLPPGVLHAQVENALTHAGAAACARHPFQLRVQRVAQGWVLELRSARGAAPHRGQGTGTRYIEASLAAVAPGGGRFVQGAEGERWCGRIELTCAS